ncbi:MAG TPA: 4-hydroxy-tetrahydrodipicolinate reductase [Chloroflexota bacterium]|nr:4-hydroxy-tetrahydrodipicolinate reductase [Chloroflexota bacterium]
MSTSRAIKVVVSGALGRMGKEVVSAVCGDPELDMAGAVDKKATEEYLSLPGGMGLIPISRKVEPMLARTKPDAMVDFTHPDAVMANIREALRHRVVPVVGTTGITQPDLEEIEGLCRQYGVGAVIAPNFAIGANLMIHFARIASHYFPAAEIIELHHDAKADAPSGTALKTAEEMLKAKGMEFNDPHTSKFLVEGVRGGAVGGIRIHSVRLPGLVAHQEVLFGGQGQTLLIRHDSINRESFMPGVIMAIKEGVKTDQLVYGLDRLMGLQ